MQNRIKNWVEFRSTFENVMGRAMTQEEQYKYEEYVENIYNLGNLDLPVTEGSEPLGPEIIAKLEKLGTPVKTFKHKDHTYLVGCIHEYYEVHPSFGDPCNPSGKRCKKCNHQIFY